MFLLLPHDWDNGGGHKPLNSAAVIITAHVLWSPRQEIGKFGDSLLPNRLLRSPEQGANLWQSDQVNTSLRSANTEGGTVAAVRKTNNFLCLMTRPFIRTQKRPNLPQGVSSSVSNVDFFRLTLAAPAYSLCTAIHIEEKVGPLWNFNLGFDNTSNSQKVCSAANLHRGVECIHSLQVDPHFQIPRRFIQINRAWIRIITASSSSFQYRYWGNIPTYQFHYSILKKGIVTPILYSLLGTCIPHF